MEIRIRKRVFHQINLINLSLILIRKLRYSTLCCVSSKNTEIFFPVKALKELLFVSKQVTQYFSYWVFLLSSINLT